jgi:hypothetical protein
MLPGVSKIGGKARTQIYLGRKATSTHFLGRKAVHIRRRTGAQRI